MFTMLPGKESKVFFSYAFFASWFVSPEMAQQVKVRPPSLPTRVLSLGPRDGERTNSHKCVTALVVSLTVTNNNVISK